MVLPDLVSPRLSKDDFKIGVEKQNNTIRLKEKPETKEDGKVWRKNTPSILFKEASFT